MCEKAVDFLKKYIDDILEKKNQMSLSYDLWEENEGIHAYSLAAIFSAFENLIKMYTCVEPEFESNRLKLENMRKEKEILEKYLLKIKEHIIKNFYDNNKKSFVRSDDGKMDISLLGLTTPFSVFSPKEKKMMNTVERINLTLRTYTGGYLRYEGDCYAGGNPWVISSLWLSQYYLDIGEKKKARENFAYVVKTASELGFLGEQIDNNTLKPAWVIGLGWSHAMFINLLVQLI
jgi:GH15 family glucan-1,4-alpha-glucosidase